MDVLAFLLALLRTAVGTFLLAFLLGFLVMLVSGLLPRPKSKAYQFIEGVLAVFVLVYIYHFSVFLSFYACEPRFFECSLVSRLGRALSESFVPSLVLSQYLILAYSVAFVVYGRMDMDNKYLRYVVSTWAFLLVVLLWFAVFPWSLEQYLRLFY